MNYTPDIDGEYWYPGFSGSSRFAAVKSVRKDTHFFMVQLMFGTYATQAEAQFKADERNALVAEMMKPKRWVPKYDECYCFVNECGDVDEWVNVNCPEDMDRFAIGNCFPSYVEAKPVARAFKAWMLERTEPK